MADNKEALLFILLTGTTEQLGTPQTTHFLILFIFSHYSCHPVYLTEW